jgi:hypothetical protein
LYITDNNDNEYELSDDEHLVNNNNSIDIPIPVEIINNKKL